MPRAKGEDKEQGRFEGAVLTSLKNLTASVNEVKGDVKDCKEKIGDLTTAQAVQAKAHENLAMQVEGLVAAHQQECDDREHCGEPQDNGNSGFLRIIIPISAVTSVIAIIGASTVAEIIKHCF